jgi:hypothetical protein
VSPLSARDAVLRDNQAVKLELDAMRPEQREAMRHRFKLLLRRLSKWHA